MLIGIECCFDAAHRLLYHTGKCKNLHGHRYSVHVRLSGPLNDEDMVLDFSEFKRKVNACLSAFDHTVLLNKADPLVDLLLDADVSVSVVDGDPTAELLAETICAMVCERLLLEESWEGRSLSVRVWETPTSFAEFEACIK